MLDKHALAALAGAGPRPGADHRSTRRRILQAQGVPADASIDLIGRRPDIAAARAGRSRRRADQGSARRLLPEHQHRRACRFQALGLGNLFASGSSFGSVSPAVSLPLFHGGALQGQYRGRRGEYDEAVAAL